MALDRVLPGAFAALRGSWKLEPSLPQTGMAVLKGRVDAETRELTGSQCALSTLRHWPLPSLVILESRNCLERAEG
jgi:hypothetical protein